VAEVATFGRCGDTGDDCPGRQAKDETVWGRLECEDVALVRLCSKLFMGPCRVNATEKASACAGRRRHDRRAESPTYVAAGTAAFRPRPRSGPLLARRESPTSTRSAPAAADPGAGSALDGRGDEAVAGSCQLLLAEFGKRTACWPTSRAWAAADGRRRRTAGVDREWSPDCT
jgi:hypothetical protein